MKTNFIWGHKTDAEHFFQHYLESEPRFKRQYQELDKYLAFDSHHPICNKKSVAKTLLRRADCPPSSLNSKAEERKYVSSVLKANGFTKTFLLNCQKPVKTNNALDERLVLLLFLTFRVLRNPSRGFWIARTLKLLKNLFGDSVIVKGF